MGPKLGVDHGYAAPVGKNCFLGTLTAGLCALEVVGAVFGI